jgi:Flp pilus assembly protein TadB
MALMRQAQRKNEQLERELAQERENLINERQKVLDEQKRLREQGELRKKMIEEYLRTRFAMKVASLTSAFLLLYGISVLGLARATRLNIYWSTILPLVVCAVLAFFVTRMTTHSRYFKPATPATQKNKTA